MFWNIPYSIPEWERLVLWLVEVYQKWASWCCCQPRVAGRPPGRCCACGVLLRRWASAALGQWCSGCGHSSSTLGGAHSRTSTSHLQLLNTIFHTCHIQNIGNSFHSLLWDLYNYDSKFVGGHVLGSRRCWQGHVLGSMKSLRGVCVWF